MDARERKQRLGMVLGLAATLTLAGCGQDLVLNPNGDTFAGRPIPLPASETQGLTIQDLPTVTVTVSAQNGGTVTLGRYTLDFPAGALTQDTPITISQTDLNAMVLELQPHGIQFQKPVTLSAQVGDLTSPDAKSVGVAWLNDSTGQWEPISFNPANTKTATGQLWHFSDYDVFQF